MRESSTYRAILAEEARKLLLTIGSRRFGAPSAAVQNAVSSIAAVERLERLSERLLDVESWDELLASG